eukprot:TRINITY_DN2867_c0_g2_i7.p1 TRINITY_DN2867_c0_g2~~TRINITY_DN2867_c0_g2_i7.p1  ORF type:complete len:225 (+),score=82.89 TRINITY_DN2867_c0_g2_i7:114-788(+)
MFFFFFLMIRRPPRSTLSSSSAASDVYKRQVSTQSTGISDKTMSRAVLFASRTLSSRCAVTVRAAPAAVRMCASAAAAPVLPEESPSITDLPVPEHLVALADTIVQLNLLEASQLNDLLKDKLGISDVPMGMGMAMPAAPAAGGSAPVEEVEVQTEFDVVLEGFDTTSKIKVIKEVRAITALGLKEAKALVEGAPNPVKTGITKEEADDLKSKLETLGATVTLK